MRIQKNLTNHIVITCCQNLFSSLSFPVCGGDVSGPSGVIQSPGYPNAYPHSRVCIWKIRGPPGRRITLSFTDFALEEPRRRSGNELECQDFVYVNIEWSDRHYSSHSWFLCPSFWLWWIDCQRSGSSKSSSLPELLLSMRFNTSWNSQLVWQEYDLNFPYGWVRHPSGIFSSIRNRSAGCMRWRIVRFRRLFRLFDLARFDITDIGQL